MPKKDLPDLDKECMKLYSGCDGVIKYRLLICRAEDDTLAYRFLCQSCQMIVLRSPKLAQKIMNRTAEITKV